MNGGVAESDRDGLGFAFIVYANAIARQVLIRRLRQWKKCDNVRF